MIKYRKSKEKFGDTLCQQDLEDVEHLVGLGVPEKEIATQFFGTSFENFSRKKAKNPELQKAIVRGKYTLPIAAQKFLFEAVTNGASDKIRLEAAMYIHKMYNKLEQGLESINNITLSFAKQSEESKRKIDDDIQKLLEDDENEEESYEDETTEETEE